MTQSKMDPVEVGFQVYAGEGTEEFGAVREVHKGRGTIVVYVENAGDFEVPASAIHAVHDHKVVLDMKRLEAPLKAAIAHAHDREERP